MKLINITHLIKFLMSILITSPCPKSTIEELGIKNWPIWTCEASSFDWTYYDKETCLLLEGKVTVTSPSSNRQVSLTS